MASTTALTTPFVIVAAGIVIVAATWCHRGGHRGRHRGHSGPADGLGDRDRHERAEPAYGHERR